MENNELNIVWCYPDILNLHGDRGNIMALKKVGELLGLKVNVIKIEKYQDEINFSSADILFFNAGELKVVEPIVNTLEKNREKLEEYVNNNKMIIAIGTTGAILAKETIRTDGTIIKGLGFLDMNCKEREAIYGDDLVYKLSENENIEINGSQIQIIDTDLNECTPLGQVTYGYGNDGKSKLEGAKNKNVIFTNCLGPVFVKNPWYAEKLIKTAMENKGCKIEKSIPDEEFDIERKSMECIKKYIEKKTSSK